MEICEAFTAKRFPTCIYGTRQLALLLERLDLRSYSRYNEHCDFSFSYCIYKWSISSYRKLSLNIRMDVVALHTIAKKITVLHFGSTVTILFWTWHCREVRAGNFTEKPKERWEDCIAQSEGLHHFIPACDFENKSPCVENGEVSNNTSSWAYWRICP